MRRSAARKLPFLNVPVVYAQSSKPLMEKAHSAETRMPRSITVSPDTAASPRRLYPKELRAAAALMGGGGGGWAGARQGRCAHRLRAWLSFDVSSKKSICFAL